MQDGIDSERVILRRNLRLYIRKAWPVVEPSTTYLANWHGYFIAEYLEAATAGQIKRPLINLPPRYAKSTSVSDVGLGAGEIRGPSAQSGARGTGHEMSLRLYAD
jgi:hypothetical protein